MADLDGSSRARLLLMVLLVVLIGALGALTLSPLLHEPGRTPRVAEAHLSFALPQGGARGGSVSVVVAGPGGRRLEHREAVAATMNEAALTGFIAEAAREAGWSDAVVEGQGVRLDGVTSLDCDPGGTVDAMSVSLTVQEPGGTHFLFGPGPPSEGLEPQAPEARFRVGLVARPPLEPESTTRESASLEVEVAATGDMGEEIGRALAEAGWGVDHPVHSLVLLSRLPDGRPVGSLLLTVISLPPESPPLSRWTLAVE